MWACLQEAAEIIECAYNDYANASQRAALVEEFYGPSFALFKVSTFWLKFTFNNFL